MKEMKFRHETKHFISYADYLAIRSRLQAVADSDPYVGENGRYLIRSLYFDNYQDKALREKIDGVNNREKFRIRYYNGDPSVIHLEKKSKIDGLCNKQSAAISQGQVEAILAGRFEVLKTEPKALFHEFYAKIMGQQLRPKVIVDYNREPYIYPLGNVRITFDTQIRTGLYSNQLFDVQLPTVSATEGNIILMEVKYDEYLPEVIRLCLQVDERPGSAFSKYAVCRRFG